MWLQLPLPMVELPAYSTISLSPVAFKTLERLLTMAITNSIISFVGTIAVASSLSEIASIYPTAALGPRSSRSAASWFTGWISIGGQIVLSASAAFAGGLEFQGLITLNHPATYVPQRWHGMLFYRLVLAYSAALNIWDSKLLPTADLASDT